ncbi:MAG TPA: hypothetical protein VHV82_01615 [Sporichthyaceae bacterium]|nr:hypothetical protein [Sporichthyaceae bacterium]
MTPIRPRGSGADFGGGWDRNGLRLPANPGAKLRVPAAEQTNVG